MKLSASVLILLAAILPLLLVYGEVLLGSPYEGVQPDRPDRQAPASVSSIHAGLPGNYMISYGYDLILEQGLLKGKASESPQSLVTADENYVPKKAKTERHSFTSLIPYSDAINFYPSLTLIRHQINVLRHQDSEAVLTSNGLGDLGFDTTFTLLAEKDLNLQWCLGLSQPIGADRDKGTAANGAEETLPAPWQPGLASPHVAISSSIVWYEDQMSLGGQVRLSEPLMVGPADVSEGRNFFVTAWISGQEIRSFSVSMRLAYTKSKGYARLTDETASWGPTFNQGAGEEERAEIFFGLNTLFFDYRFGFEYGEPMYQTFKAWGVARQSYGVATWQYAY